MLGKGLAPVNDTPASPRASSSEKPLSVFIFSFLEPVPHLPFLTSPASVPWRGQGIFVMQPEKDLVMTLKIYRQTKQPSQKRVIDVWK